VKTIKIYTTETCPHCFRAKRLLQRKNVPYEEIDVSWDDAARMQLMQRTGRRTVPQIFIGEHHVGGSNELHALEAGGELDMLLQ
jgi:glutaredoxin 3